MLAELCKELNNWDFQRRVEKYIDSEIHIENGQLQDFDGILKHGQYYRIVGSTFNEGIYKHPCYTLNDEVFSGAIWAMYIPAEILALDAEIEAWRAKYEAADSPATSPFSSEKFGEYSYTKDSGASSDWRSVFSSKLDAWRKI